MRKGRNRGKASPFQIIIAGFLGLILAGTLLLMLPISRITGEKTPFVSALFTAVSAVCVTGLVVMDTATSWSIFGQGVLLVLIQIGGLGVVALTAFIASLSGRRMTLLQRSTLVESIAAHQAGGVVSMTVFIIKVLVITESIGALLLMPSFIPLFGAKGVWMALFHSVSAFCNAGFDLMGSYSGEYSSLTGFSSSPLVVLPISLLIVFGGIGFLTWDDIVRNRFSFKAYRMQSLAILATTGLLILIPAALLFFLDFSSLPMKQRLLLSFFQAITPRTAGFNTADLTMMTSASRALLIVLMLIGGSPGSTAGGMKTTTLAVLVANIWTVVHRKKSIQMFSRRIEESTLRYASTLLILYIGLSFTGAFLISAMEKQDFALCIFETASAIGTVGLSLGLTPTLSSPSLLVLILLMFFGRVGGLTLLFAAVGGTGVELSQLPLEKINVG